MIAPRATFSELYTWPEGKIIFFAKSFATVYLFAQRDRLLNPFF